MQNKNRVKTTYKNYSANVQNLRMTYRECNTVGKTDRNSGESTSETYTLDYTKEYG